MNQSLPLVLSATALAVALVGSTPLGQAAGQALEAVVPRATSADFAKNAGKLNGRRSALFPRAGQIPVVRADGKLPASIVAAQPGGGLDGYQLVVEQVTIPNGEKDFRRVVSCPGGKAALSGGWDFETVHATDLSLFDSHPVSRSEWRFRISNDTGGAKESKTLYVLCANAGP